MWRGQTIGHNTRIYEVRLGFVNIHILHYRFLVFIVLVYKSYAQGTNCEIW